LNDEDGELISRKGYNFFVPHNINFSVDEMYKRLKGLSYFNGMVKVWIFS